MNPQELLVFQEDALEFLKRMPSKSVDLVITDPPYESINKWRSMGSAKCRRLMDWFPSVSYDYLAECIQELRRVLKPNSHCYIFGDWETIHGHVYPDAERAKFKTWPPIVWNRMATGMGYHYRRTTEFIAFLERGKRKLSDLSVPNLLSHKRVQGKFAYPTEKPVSLCEVLIKQSSCENQVVLDPFCGSGSVGVAALRHGRRFI